MARSLRSLRQVATLRHGHMARRSFIIGFHSGSDKQFGVKKKLMVP